MAGNPAVASHMRAIGRICADTYGLKVVELAGWTTRGRSATFTPAYTIEHHTAAPVDITAMLINGRPDLSGPLCNFELRKDGTVALLAAGRANHAGVASVSATESYGIEATGPIPTGNTGADAFPQYGAYVRLVAAICLHHNWGTDRVKAHKEIAPARKIDPVFDMDAFRAAVRAAMTGKSAEQEAWWMADEIPASELQKIEAQAVQALQSGPGQAAITQGVIAALSYRPPAISENHKALTITEFLGVYSSAGYPAIMRNQATGLANQAAARAALDALNVAPGGGGDPLTPDQVTEIADAIAASLKDSLAADIVNALAEALID